MEKDRRLELIDLAIQKLMHDNSDDDKVQGFQHDNLKDHDGEYQLALSHLLSVSQSQLEMLKRDETHKQSEASSPNPEPVGSVIKKKESENSDAGEVDGGCRGSENDEIIIKELKKVKRQNFVTHCLLSAMIVLTVAWQLSEVSLIMKVKEGINNPFRCFGNMLKGMVKEKVTDMNGQVAADNKENNESTSFPSLKILEMPQMDVPNLGKE